VFKFVKCLDDHKLGNEWAICPKNAAKETKPSSSLVALVKPKVRVSKSS